jgi:hypothetical protein
MAMTEEELLAQQVTEFQTWLKNQPWWPLQPDQPGHTGPLVNVFLPPDQVDEMEVAIEEEFEKVEPDADDDAGF